MIAVTMRRKALLTIWSGCAALLLSLVACGPVKGDQDTRTAAQPVKGKQVVRVPRQAPAQRELPPGTEQRRAFLLREIAAARSPAH